MTGEAPAPPTHFRIELPPRIDGEEPGVMDLVAGSASVFLGANGAGKTRLAGWLDRKLGNQSTFIYARRSIEMPSTYEVADERVQIGSIYAGVANAAWVEINQMKEHRYRHGEYSANDFANTLNILGTRDSSANRKFRLEFDSSGNPPAKVRTELDAALEIWSKCLPHLSIDASNVPKLAVKRLDGGGDPYEPREMSDGERAIFYLVARCLIAPANAIIIVDEPEMYVHASIRNQLWDALEQERRDCAFIYCTHDIDFAANRNFSSRFILSRCAPMKGKYKTDSQFEYHLVRKEDDIPEAILINVLGSRQKVLFLEGDASSLDRKIAAARYSGMQLRFLGGCEDVIRLVKALRRTPQVHHKHPVGLIDADFRRPKECEGLAADFVFVHKMREIENILVSQKVVEAALMNLAKGAEAAARIADMRDTVKKRVQSKIAVVADKMAIRELRVQTFHTLDQVQRGKLDLPSIAWPDGEAIEQECLLRVKEVWAGDDWDTFLSLFSARKDDFRDIAARRMGFNNWEEAEHTLLGWLGDTESDNGKRLRVAIAHYLPEIPHD